MMGMPVDLRELRRLAAVNGLGMDEARALHHFLIETFGRGAIIAFRLMPGRNGARQASLYAYSTRDADALRNVAEETAPPELIGMLGVRNLKSKPMPENWTAGHRLAFDVRVKPVRRLLKPLEGWSHSAFRKEQKPFRKGAEVDAFLVAALRRFPEGPPEGFSARQFRAETYLAWLIERLAPTARLEKAEIASADRKASLRGDVISHGPDVTFHGELTITNPEGFTRLLRGGIGRHTAYGFGMLLLRPAGR